MRVELIRCEVCPNETEAKRELPHEWLTVSQSSLDKDVMVPATAYLGDTPISGFWHKGQFSRQEWHFCSRECLAKWLGVAIKQPDGVFIPEGESGTLTFVGRHLSDGTVISLASGTIYKPVSEDIPQSKMRRFLLANGETAEETEGVLFSNGAVILDPGTWDARNDWFCKNWEAFKAAHPGDGVTWIDRIPSETIASESKDSV